ncbi:MAG: hypothetical protein Q9160_002895 [Pyrenula sp. 1 TL-2023]
MAPRGQYSRSCYCFSGLSFVVLAITTISIAIFREELLSKLSAIQSLKPPSSTCDHYIGLPPSSPADHQHDSGKPTEQRQPSIPSVYKDLTILDELPPSNVLWVNRTSTSQPQAWGISMFHALHCVKMWKESLNSATMMDSHVHSESEYAEHAGHCINYLIQVSSTLEQIGSINLSKA